VDNLGKLGRMTDTSVAPAHKDVLRISNLIRTVEALIESTWI
jgi:hypothetical protein